MKTLKIFGLSLLLVSISSFAETPEQILNAWKNDGNITTWSSTKGQEFFTQKRNISKTMASCSACHGSDLRTQGEHIITGRKIMPMAISANPERFQDPKKIEKWFKRNCSEVVGRECTAQEKGDILTWILTIK